MKVKFVKKSNIHALGILFAYIGIYFLCLIGVLAATSTILSLLISIATGFAIGRIFILGHDACHGAYTNNQTLNKIISRICFFPSIHSAVLWDQHHNRRHHGFANIKGMDPVWTPMSKIEFDRAPLYRRLLERIYRSPFGAGLYYFIEIWVKLVSLPWHKHNRRVWREHIVDSLIVILSLIFHPLFVLYLGGLLAPQKLMFEVYLLGYLLPFLVWNQIMGFVVYVHHTHPQVAWFNSENSKSYQDRIFHVTPHVSFPEPLSSMVGSIIEHTAHHINPDIPIYNLKYAQGKLESMYPEKCLTYMCSLGKYLEIVKACKLFDFERACWTDFEGNPTASPIKIDASSA